MFTERPLDQHNSDALVQHNMRTGTRRAIKEPVAARPGSGRGLKVKAEFISSGNQNARPSGLACQRTAPSVEHRKFCQAASAPGRFRPPAPLLLDAFLSFRLYGQVARRPRGRPARQSPPLPRSRLSGPRRLTTTPRKASSKIEFTSVERSVPRREANTVSRRSFSGVKSSEHLRRSAAFPFCGFARGGFLVFGFPASWLIGSTLHESLRSGLFLERISADGDRRLGANAP